MPFLTTLELDAARVHYRGGIIPKPALSLMEAQTEALRASGLAARALKEGATAPDFILPDVSGEPVRLYSLLKEGPVILLFYRGRWCPYCNLHLRGFERALSRLLALNAQVIAVSPQLPDHSLATREKNGLTFPLLSDVGNKVAARFGITYVADKSLLELYASFGHPLEAFNGPDGASELPVPAAFLIGRNGVIRLAHVDADHTRRLDPDTANASIAALK